MEPFKPKFSRIEAPIGQRRRLPLLGKIRLGIKKISARSGKEYPAETPYFVVPENVALVYGPEPTRLDVMLPHDSLDVVFPSAYKWYGMSKGLRCTGNGVEAERLQDDHKTWLPMKCPCEKLKSNENPQGECVPGATLYFMIPKVSLGGCYALRTSSFNSMVDLASGLEFARSVAGRILLVPLILRREPRETHHDGKKQIHYTCAIGLDASVSDIQKLRDDTTLVLNRAQYMIEQAPDENPDKDPPDQVTDEEPDEPEAKREQEQPKPTPALAEPTPKLVLTMNPDGAEREQQARLVESPIVQEAVRAAVADAGKVKVDPYPAPTNVRDAELAWETWHKDAQNYPVPYTQTQQRLKIPNGKPIYRALRNEFKKVFEEILQKGAQ